MDTVDETGEPRHSVVQQRRTAGPSFRRARAGLFAALLASVSGIVVVASIIQANGIIGPARRSAIPRVGYPMLVCTGPQRMLEAFQAGLQEQGYFDGKNLILEIRCANGQVSDYPRIVAELVNLPVDVIVAPDSLMTPQIMRATTSIPIVMIANGDPVRTGLVDNLARPGGNLTGLAFIEETMNPKRLEILHAVVPEARRIGVLRNVTTVTAEVYWRALLAAAESFDVELISLDLRGPEDFDAAFSVGTTQGIGGLLVVGDSVTTNFRQVIVDWARDNRLPAIYQNREFVSAGGMMSYGPVRAHNYRRAAAYVDMLLKGAKASELPIEQAAQFELVLKLSQFQALGLSMPRWVQERVTEALP